MRKFYHVNYASQVKFVSLSYHIQCIVMPERLNTYVSTNKFSMGPFWPIYIILLISVLKIMIVPLSWSKLCSSDALCLGLPPFFSFTLPLAAIFESVESLWNRLSKYRIEKWHPSLFIKAMVCGYLMCKELWLATLGEEAAVYQCSLQEPWQNTDIRKKVTFGVHTVFPSQSCQNGSYLSFIINTCYFHSFWSLVHWPWSLCNGFPLDPKLKMDAIHDGHAPS